jgi:hypothetical protein
MASGANNTFRQVGIATGIAALGAVFQSQIQHATAVALRSSATGQEVLTRGGTALNGALAGGGVRQVAALIPSASARATLLHAYRVGFASTLDHLMIIGVVIAAIGSVGAFSLIRQRDFVPSYAPPAADLEQPAVASSTPIA